MIRGACLSLLGFVAGCADCDEELAIEVSVADSNGAVLSDAEVMLLPDGAFIEDAIACPANGDGTYQCLAPEPGEYRLYVEPAIPAGGAAFYESYGTTLTVEEPEKCGEPALTHAAVVRFESGGA